jgi:hypothetical protein
MAEGRKPIAGDEGLSEVSTHGRERWYHQSEFCDIIRPYLASGSICYVGNVLRQRSHVPDLSHSEQEA